MKYLAVCDFPHFRTIFFLREPFACFFAYGLVCYAKRRRRRSFVSWFCHAVPILIRLFLAMPRVAPEMRDRLARCAFDIFAERGFRDGSVDGIAAGAGVTKGSFSSHYRSKRTIVPAACNACSPPRYLHSR